MSSEARRGELTVIIGLPDPWTEDDRQEFLDALEALMGNDVPSRFIMRAPYPDGPEVGPRGEGIGPGNVRMQALQLRTWVPGPQEQHPVDVLSLKYPLMNAFKARCELLIESNARLRRELNEHTELNAKLKADVEYQIRRQMIGAVENLQHAVNGRDERIGQLEEQLKAAYQPAQARQAFIERAEFRGHTEGFNNGVIWAFQEVANMVGDRLENWGVRPEQSPVSAALGMQVDVDALNRANNKLLLGIGDSLPESEPVFNLSPVTEAEVTEAEWPIKGYRLGGNIGIVPEDNAPDPHADEGRVQPYPTEGLDFGGPDTRSGT